MKCRFALITTLIFNSHNCIGRLLKNFMSHVSNGTNSCYTHFRNEKNYMLIPKNIQSQVIKNFSNEIL